MSLPTKRLTDLENKATVPTSGLPKTETTTLYVHYFPLTISITLAAIILLLP